MNLPATNCRVSNINCLSLDGLVRLRREGIKGRGDLLGEKACLKMHFMINLFA